MKVKKYVEPWMDCQQQEGDYQAKRTDKQKLTPSQEWVEKKGQSHGLKEDSNLVQRLCQLRQLPIKAAGETHDASHKLKPPKEKGRVA